MRGIYEFKKESYLVHEMRSWDYPSDHEDMYHEVSSPTPSIHKMLQKPSSEFSTSLYDHRHHDNMVFNGNRRWHDHESHEENGLAFNGNRGWDGSQKSRGLCGTTHHMNRENFTVKKNDHQALGPKTTMLRPPLGSVSPPSHHQYRHQTMYEGSRQGVASRDERQDFRGKGPPGSVSPPGHKIKYGSWTEAPRKYGGYDHNERLGESLESLIKGLNDSGLGNKVKKIELIEYEETTAYGGGLRVYQKSYPYYTN